MTDKKRYYRQKTGPASFSSIALPRPNQLILYFCRVMLRQVPFRQHSFFYLVRVYFKVCALFDVAFKLTFSYIYVRIKPSAVFTSRSASSIPEPKVGLFAINTHLDFTNCRNQSRLQAP